MTKRYRDYNLAILLLLGSALLSAIFLTQWLHYRGKQSDMKKLLATKLETRMEVKQVEEQHFELPGLEEYAATIERPLFMEGRRPVVEDANEPEQAPVEKKPLNFKLMGVAFFPPNETVGLFVDAQGKYKRLHINDSIGGWKVSKIEPDKAIVEQEGMPQEELKLVKPKSKKNAGKPGGMQPPMGQPGQMIPGQPMPSQVMPPFGVNPNDPNFPEEPIEPEIPNEPVDETAMPIEEPPNVQ